MAEGFLEIIGIDYPEMAQEGQEVNFIVHTQNTGVDDNFRVEAEGLARGLPTGTIESGGSTLYQALIYGGRWNAQTFTLGTTGENADYILTSVSLNLTYRRGDPGIITAFLRNVDENGKPTGPDLSIGSISSLVVPTNYTNYLITIPMSEYNLEESTQYAIIIKVEGADSNNRITCGRSSSSNYEGGSFVTTTNAGTDWTVIDADVRFIIVGYKSKLISEFSLASGSTQDVSFSFTMPNQDVSAMATAYHLESPSQVVIFRTNANIRDYGCGAYNASQGFDGVGTWIAYDVEGNGNLVGFGRTNGSLTEFNCHTDPSFNPQGIDAAGGCKLYKRDNDNIGVCMGFSYPRRFSTSDSDADNAILDSTPLEPFASNGQEVYA